MLFPILWLYVGAPLMIVAAAIGFVLPTPVARFFIRRQKVFLGVLFGLVLITSILIGSIWYVWYPTYQCRQNAPDNPYCGEFTLLYIIGAIFFAGLHVCLFSLLNFNQIFNKERPFPSHLFRAATRPIWIEILVGLLAVLLLTVGSLLPVIVVFFILKAWYLIPALTLLPILVSWIFIRSRRKYIGLLSGGGFILLLLIDSGIRSLRLYQNSYASCQQTTSFDECAMLDGFFYGFHLVSLGLLFFIGIAGFVFLNWRLIRYYEKTAVSATPTEYDRMGT